MRTGPSGRLAAEWLAALEDELPGARRLRWRIHAEPRLSHDEHDTAAAVSAAMGAGLEPVDASAARVGLLPGAAPEAIALRAELDALPVEEASGSPHAASGGVMHACGHDVHLAALTALVRAAAGLDLPYALAPVLQPSEESYPSGALALLRSGVLERLGVRRAVAAHVHPGVAPGRVAAGGGVINAAADELRIRLEGSGGHGAYPHRAADAVAPIAAIALGLPELVRRTVDRMSPALVSIGTLSAGSGAANVLPGSASLLATVRTSDEGERRTLLAAIERFSQAHAAAYGLLARVELVAGEPVLRNDPRLAAEVRRLLPRLGLAAAEPLRSLGADDFSYLSEAFPSIMMFTGVRTPGADPEPSLHDPRFLPPDEAVDAVARTLLAGYLAAAETLREA